MPLSYMHERDRIKLLMDTRDVLGEAGEFIVYLFRRQVRQMLMEFWNEVEQKWALWNIPPLRVFHARYPKEWHPEGLNEHAKSLSNGHPVAREASPQHVGAEVNQL
jgi:hypothetical protein